VPSGHLRQHAVEQGLEAPQVTVLQCRRRGKRVEDGEAALDLEVQRGRRQARHFEALAFRRAPLVVHQGPQAQPRRNGHGQDGGDRHPHEPPPQGDRASRLQFHLPGKREKGRPRSLPAACDYGRESPQRKTVCMCRQGAGPEIIYALGPRTYNARPADFPVVM
jgi:hypothetical protein